MTIMAADTEHQVASECLTIPQARGRAARDIATDELWTLLDSLPAGHPDRLDARNELVALHMPLVRFLAQRYRNRGEMIDDVIQVGSVGLIKSVDRFDRTRGVAFSTFATPTILGEIRRHFRDRTWMVRVPRPLQDLKARLSAAREDLSQQLGRSPTIAEIAAFLELTEEQVLDGLEAANAYSAISIEAPSDGESSIGLAIEARLGVIDEGLDLVERRQCVAPLLDALPERERRIIFLRFFRDMTQSEIAAELGISQMHVSRLLTRTLAQLQARLTEGLRPALP
jgi:RNA polymerase sigma-B factor